MARSRCRKLRDEKKKREEEERRKKEEEEKKGEEQVKGGDAGNEEDEEAESTQVSSERSFLLYSQTVKCISRTFSLCFSAALSGGADSSDGGDPEAGEGD